MKNIGDSSVWKEMLPKIVETDLMSQTHSSLVIMRTNLSLGGSCVPFCLLFCTELRLKASRLKEIFTLNDHHFCGIQNRGDLTH